MKKICRICKEEKEICFFHKKKDTKDGYRNECKCCVKDIQKKYIEVSTYKEKRSNYNKDRYLKNKDKILQDKKKYHQENKDKINSKKKEYNNQQYVKERQKSWWQKYKNINDKKLKEYHKIYRMYNKDKIYEWRKKNPHIIAWRSLLYSTLKRFGTKKQKHTIEELGYSAQELKTNLELKFLPSMTWNNYGEWHIDHIKPVSLFDKNTSVKIVCGLSNLQPLWATTREIEGIVYEGNLNKNNKYL